MEKKLFDNELGTILIRTHPRARHYNLKVREGQVIATMPPGGNEPFLLSFIEQNREKLRSYLHSPAKKTKTWDENSQLHTATFQLRLVRTERANFYMKLEEGILHIACPSTVLFEDVKVQTIIKDLIERALRHEARRVLPKRLHQLAGQYQFSCGDVKINKSKSRWGSCNTKKNINLSYYLMLLPQHLIDYVLLHELCHTRELNHSERFWKLMDQVTGNQAKALRTELKGFHTSL